ncbi:MAG: outer membrane lipoprotein-sorting protein [Nevskiales bacterium]
MTRYLSIALLALSPALLGFKPYGDTAAARGQALADELEKRAADFGTIQSSVTMVTRNARGGETSRKLDIKVMDMLAGIRSLAVITAPADERGTALLTYTYSHLDDEQWIYFPAIGQARTIQAKGRSGPFMGSEFSYEDMTGQSFQKYDYELSGEAACEVDGAAERCWLLKRFPHKKLKSRYQYSTAWIDQKHLRLLKTEFYDRHGDHLKTFEAKGFSLYADKYWRAQNMTMLNVVSGNASTLIWDDVRYGEEIDLSVFRLETLEGKAP